MHACSEPSDAIHNCVNIYLYNTVSRLTVASCGCRCGCASTTGCAISPGRTTPRCRRRPCSRSCRTWSSPSCSRSSSPSSCQRWASPRPTWRALTASLTPQTHPRSLPWPTGAPHVHVPPAFDLMSDHEMWENELWLLVLPQSPLLCTLPF